jgi:hypothetical protein
MSEPWKIKPLDQWSIVGMNHYHVDDQRRLFVAMTKDGRCITEEGADDQYLWNRLCHKARAAESDRLRPKPLGLSDEQVQEIVASAK